MYIFYRFIDIYRFSTSSPAHDGGVFYILTNALPISQLSLCSQERLDGARGREGAGQGSSSMAEGPRPGTALPLPGPSGSTWGQVQALAQHFQHPVLLLQQQSCELRQGSDSRRCYFQKKKPHNHNPQTSALGTATSPSPGGLSPGRSCWSSQMVPSRTKVKRVHLSSPSSILSKEAEEQLVHAPFPKQQILHQHPQPRITPSSFSAKSCSGGYLDVLLGSLKSSFSSTP